MKKLFTFILIFAVSSCVYYRKDENLEKTLTKKELFEGYGVFSKPSYYTRENIISDFGAPKKQCLIGNKEVLTYEKSGKELMRAIVLLVLPIKYKASDETYKYSFVLKDNKFEELRYQDVVSNVYGLGLMFPPFNKKQYDTGETPWEVYGCDEKHSKITVDTSHMAPGYYRSAETCYTNKVLGFNGFEKAFDDIHKLKKGYKKVFLMSSYIYDEKRFDASKKSIDEELKKTWFSGKQINYNDNSITKENYKTKEIDCTIFSGSAKDYNAYYKAGKEYLIIDASLAICHSKKHNMVIVLDNSNRYPKGDKDINAVQEIKNVIKSIEIKD